MKNLEHNNDNYKYIFIDTHSIFHRIYHSLKKAENQLVVKRFYDERNQPYEVKEPKFKPLIKNLNGVATNVSTLVRYVLHLQYLRELYPQSEFIHLLDPMDIKTTFKHHKNPTYKENREEKDEELKIQLEKLPKLLDLLNQINIRSLRFEADDLIASLTRQEIEENKYSKVLIYSKDKDLLQCMFDEKRVHFLREIKKDLNGLMPIVIKTEEEVKNFIGVLPKHVPEFLALVGDSSDNIKGLKGIGKETASFLLNNYESIENMLLHKDGFKPNIQKTLMEKENIDLFVKNVQELTTCNFFVPFPKTLNELRSNYLNKTERERVKDLEIASRVTNIKNFAFLKQKDLSLQQNKEMTYTNTMAKRI